MNLTCYFYKCLIWFVLLFINSAHANTFNDELGPPYFTPSQVWNEVYASPTLMVYQGSVNAFGIKKIYLKLNVQATQADFIHLLLNENKAPDWIVDNLSVNTLHAKSDNEHIVQSVFNAPWPMKKRVLTTHSTITHQSNVTTIIINRYKGLDPPAQYNLYAIPFFKARYQLTQHKNELIVEYWVSGSAGRFIPNWLANKVLKDNLIQTFLNLSTQLNPK